MPVCMAGKPLLTPAPCCVGQVGKQGKLDSLEILRRKIMMPFNKATQKGDKFKFLILDRVSVGVGNDF